MIAQRIRNVRPARGAPSDELALFDKCEHTGQGIFDDARAILVNFPAEADRVRHITPYCCARLFKFAKQKRFLSPLGKEHLDRLEVCAGHGEDVRGAIDQGACKRLAAETADVHAFLFANLHRVKARGLSAYRVHAR